MKAYFYTHTHLLTVTKTRGIEIKINMEEQIETEFDIFTREGALKWYVTHIATHSKCESFMDTYTNPNYNNFDLTSYNLDDAEIDSKYYIVVNHSTLGNKKLKNSPSHWKFAINIFDNNTNKIISKFDYSIPKESDEQLAFFGFQTAMVKYKLVWLDL